MLRRLRIENLVLIRSAELELAPGLNAITGETGAGKTILAQAIGLLLGAKGESASVGPGASEAYVEAELDLPVGLLEEDGLEALAGLRPEDDDGLVVARRLTAEGRSRAYAWGRSVAREDLATVGDRLIAMSGQFQQRRLARPAYQLDVLDDFVGGEQLRRRAELRRSWRELVAARRRRDEVAASAAAAEARLAELRALAQVTEGLEPGEEEVLRSERERLRHATELAAAAAGALLALDPDEGDGAAALTAAAERALAGVESLAAALAAATAELREAEVRLRETASELRAFLAGLEAEPQRLEEVEEGLERIADAKRRFRCATYEELLERAGEARAQLGAAEEGADPLAVAEEAIQRTEERVAALATELGAARRTAADAFASRVAGELQGIGLGEGEFSVELRERELGTSGADEVRFFIRPNRGLQPAPVAETASGGELSRIALALAVVAGDRSGPEGVRTMIFDEIDAGIGGQTAHAVGEALRRLARRAQVVTITHLPQIASRADRHFRVEKVAGDPTHTRIELLDDEARREELERMLGGQELLALLASGNGV